MQDVLAGVATTWKLPDIIENISPLREVIVLPQSTILPFIIFDAITLEFHFIETLESKSLIG